jgi:tetratricopeptide (TPR) repeat protein
MERSPQGEDQERLRLGLALLVAALAGCRAPAPAAEQPSPEPPPAAAPEFEEAEWRAEMEAIVFERHLATARRYRDAFELEKALDHVDRALALRPEAEEARELRLDLQRMAGMRAGEARTLLDDAWETQRAREEQRLVDARRLLAEAREAEKAGDLEGAIEKYKRALYLAGEDRELRDEARSSLEKAR